MKRLDTRRLASPRFCMQSLLPAFSDNYKPGYVGFTYTGSPLLSRGISYFTRWSRLSDIHVTGVLVVTGENEGVELTGGREVTKVDLAKLFDDPKTQIFFRKPRKCTSSLGEAIAATAIAQVGTRFDQLVVAAQILEGSFLKRWISSQFAPARFLSRLAQRDGRWLGAELAAYCLDCQPAYAGRGLLGRTSCEISPQDLFEDEELFSAWSQEPVEGLKRPA